MPEGKSQIWDLWFEICLVFVICCLRFQLAGRSLVGKAPGWGSGDRWFESSRPDHAKRG